MFNVIPHLDLGFELELDLEVELVPELELELELELEELELELDTEMLQDVLEVPDEPDVPDEELPELLFEPSSEPPFANAGVAAAKVPTSKKASSLCFIDLIR